MGIVAAYVRVSTQDQEAQGTHEAQTDKITNFCASRGFQVQEWFQEQESTLNLHRPKFQMLLEKLRDGVVSTIVVSALDRFSRDQVETLQTMKLIKKMGASFYCVEQNISIEDGKVGVGNGVLTSVMSLIAENERETIKARTMAGKRRKTAKGLWINGQAPCGYELDRQTKILRKNKKEAAIVQRIWNEKCQGRGINAILKGLTMDGVPLFQQQAEFPGVRTCSVNRRERSSNYCRLRPKHTEYQQCIQCVEKHGAILKHQKLWPKNTVSRILKNKVYLGLVPHEKGWVAGNHESLITPQQWDQVQKSFRERYAAKKRAYPSNPLAGLVRCGQCGNKMFATTAGARKRQDGTMGPNWAAFRCPGSKGGICSQGSVSIKKIREEVYHYIDQIFVSDRVAEILQSAFDGLKEHWGSGDIGELHPLAEGIAELESEKKKLVTPIVDAAERGFEDLYRRLMERADAIDLRIKGLRNQIALIRLQAETQRADLEELRQEEIISAAGFAWLAGRELSTTSDSEQVRNRMGELVAGTVRSFVKEVRVNRSQIHVEPLLLGDEFGEVASYLVWAVLQWRNLYAKVSDKAALAQSIPSS